MRLAFGKSKGHRKIMKEKFKWLYRKEVKPDINGFFLLFCAIVFTLLRIPSLVEPDWYGDEGIYQVIGRAILNGRLLYSEIWDNKPPLLYIYYAFVNGDLFWIRLLSLVFGIGAIISFYLLSKNIFANKKLPIYLSTISFSVLFGLPLIEGNVANAENFMLFPIILSLLLVTKLKSTSKSIIPITSGFLLSIAFLTKIVAIFDLSAFILILFCLRFSKNSLINVRHHTLSKPLEFVKALKQEVLILISFLTPIMLVSLFFIFRGAFTDYIRATLSQNVGYVGYANYLFIPQGLLVLKLGLLIFGSFLIVIYRKKLGTSGIIIYSWLMFSMFNAFFSGRPYPHYVLAILPSLCLLFGSIFIFRKNFIFNIIVFITPLVLINKNFNFYTKIFPYYNNYFEFLTEKKSVQKYQAFFDKATPVNYKIAEFIRNNTARHESVFLLSDRSPIYFLSDKLPPGRYIVEYHISFYNDAVAETQKALNEKKPKYIIVTKKRFLGDFVKNYVPKYQLDGVDIYEREF